jgi:hypothetical protein
MIVLLMPCDLCKQRKEDVFPVTRLCGDCERKLDANMDWPPELLAKAKDERAAWEAVNLG